MDNTWHNYFIMDNLWNNTMYRNLALAIYLGISLLSTCCQLVCNASLYTISQNLTQTPKISIFLEIYSVSQENPDSAKNKL